jgi:phospholipid transport system transporter-binding protein
MSGATAIRSGGPGVLLVVGVLDFATVPALAAEGERLLPVSGRVEIDLSGVTAANSAGLALLLEWLEIARQRKLGLRFRALPDPLVRLARLTNLTNLLPVSPAGG